MIPLASFCYQEKRGSIYRWFLYTLIMLKYKVVETVLKNGIICTKKEVAYG